jgi:signal transduction histidine kinase
MNLSHILHYDGFLHWCFLLALFGAVASAFWVMLRVLLPLHYLASLADGIASGDHNRFAEPIGGIKEIDLLRRNLHDMLNHVRIAQEREIAYRNALSDGQEQERMRIAREIHDDTIQSLVLVSHHIERAARHSDPAASVLPHLKNAREQVLDIVERLRRLIANLRPSILDELGVVTAIKSLCQNTAGVTFQVTGQVYSLPQAQELALFRAAQEALHNAKRHAQAKHINAALVYSNNAVVLSVHDDGIGFDVPGHLQALAAYGHYGLLGIAERAKHLGGWLKLSSALGAGTTVEVTFPVSSTSSASLPNVQKRLPIRPNPIPI